MRRVVVLLILAVGIVGAWWAYDRFVGVDALPEGLIQANGRLEGDPVLVSSKYPGRIAAIEVEEGDAVRAGDSLVLLESDEVEARVRQAEAATKAAEHEVAAFRSQCEQAGRDADRFRELYAEGTATKREAEQAELAEQVSMQKQTAAEANRQRAEAAYDEVCAALEDLTLTAPSDGVVTNRLYEPGAVIAAGAPVLTLVDLDALYLQVYVPERQIGKLRRGLAARIHTDAFPDRPFNATVSHIASRAEFTPKEVQTPDERVKLVYAVKLKLQDNPDHVLTPGVPADAVIRWDDSVPWSAPVW
ncbi:HlyD family secretion protein [Elongatibacter sediminis]